MSDLLVRAEPVQALNSPRKATTGETGKRVRSGGIDAVRVLGLLAVIAGHVWLNSTGLRTVIFPWHVPVFFFLTGYLWHTNRSLIGETRKRFVSLAVPYIVWVLGAAFIYSLVEYVTADTSWKELGRILLGEQGSRPFQTYWFVSALFLVAILYRLLARVPWWGQASLALLSLGLGAVWGGALSNTPFSAGSALYCVGFVMLGALARGWAPRLRMPGLTGLLLLALGAVLLLLGVDAVDLSPGDLGTPLLSGLNGAVISFGLVLVFEWLFTHLPGWCSTVASVLAAPALVVLLLHPLLLWAFQTPADGDLGQYLLIVGISWAAGLLIVRSPLAPYLAGLPYRVRVA